MKAAVFILAIWTLISFSQPCCEIEAAPSGALAAGRAAASVKAPASEHEPDGRCLSPCACSSIGQTASSENVLTGPPLAAPEAARAALPAPAAAPHQRVDLDPVWQPPKA